MKNEQWKSLLRTILTLIGAFLTGGGIHYFFGQVIDTAYWEQITGIVLGIFSVVWSWTTKTLDIEQLQGVARQTITFICGILLARNVLNANTAMAVITFVGAIIPFFQAGLARKKNEDIVTGKINVMQLKRNRA